MMMIRCCLLLVALLVGSPMAVCGSDISGLVSVQEDATLRISGKNIRLYGIYIPSTDTTCRTFESPVLCGPRAYLALEFKAKGFVHCERKGVDEDGIIIGRCYAERTPFDEGVDLSLYMLRHGWAAAREHAPIEYRVAERRARHLNRGIWGVPVDVIERRRPRK